MPPKFQLKYNSLVITVQVTKKHLAGRIDLVDSSLDENKQIIEGTRDQVGTLLPHTIFVYLVLMHFEVG